ncbi:hypothetical protein M3223_00185 [Paenibacillus pasadenensis]|uniref:hypothetical protein n=1 Tax=Paenibacillus pasadenensis TaxID=217090 RepID=UPI00203E0933|nr:hypothetical protein [Paenibacillus pasadenensis]MCM3745759.1 hypothetical protein [Paenibacillus pasadenensis]
MKYLNWIAIFLVTILMGCENKQMSLEDTVYQYYELIFQGQMEESQELLDWDLKEGSIIDYYANMSQQHRKYDLVSLQKIEFTILNEKNGVGTTEVKLVYVDRNDKERIEINKVKLRLNSESIWKIISITNVE